ncbi:UDP-N-acetylmuramate-alanine ligase [Limosilactobacillus coleohominis DSM 14060]|nr:UDP-N-acetylmuramate-alanine ligase [Limosilactobacillus coleohominis DSM 14060]
MEHVDLTAIQKELADFNGVKRRFSESKLGDMTIIDDYAHHPSEINATIDAARQKYPDKELVVVFQPHTYSRLQAYLKEFGQALSKADQTFVTPIFGSIRENAGHVSSADLEQLIPDSEDIDMKTMNKLLNYHHAVVVFMGAGDIEKYEDEYARLLKK